MLHVEKRDFMSSIRFSTDFLLSNSYLRNVGDDLVHDAEGRDRAHVAHLPPDLVRQ